MAKQLDCLARVGDAAGYRRVLASHAERLQLSPFNPENPERFLARARTAVAKVQVAFADGRSQISSGFLVSDRLLATSQRWLVEADSRQRTPVDVGRVLVRMFNGQCRVEHVFLSRSPHLDVALLRLVEPSEAAPLRLGHANLVRIGDPVWTILPGTDIEEALVAGIVNKFESFSEWNMRLFKVGLCVPSQHSGGPLLNDLGEVVGILTVKERSSEPKADEPCFAQTIESLEPLLAAAGLGTLANV